VFSRRRSIHPLRPLDHVVHQLLDLLQFLLGLEKKESVEVSLRGEEELSVRSE
jgi:hypothetical protein